MMTLKKKIQIEKKYLESLEVIEKEDEESTGVLLSDRIKHYAEKYKLIWPFCEKNLKPAGYELTVGDEYYLGGEHYTFKDKEHRGYLTIPPFQIAVLKTAERVCLPRFLIARWNIRVRHAYSGLLWVGAAQVDPGYKGYLFCPIYNLSHTDVTLRQGEELALIDFVKTTKFKKGESLEYPPNKRPVIEAFKIDDLKSALYTTAAKKIDTYEHTIQSIENRVGSFTTLIFAILAIILTVLALLFGSSREIKISVSLWSGLIIFFSVFAVLMTTFSYVTRRATASHIDRLSHQIGYRIPPMRRIFRRNWWLALSMSLLSALVFAAVVVWIAQPLISKSIDGQVVMEVELRDRLERNATALKKDMEILVQTKNSERNKKISDLEKRLMVLEKMQKRK